MPLRNQENNLFEAFHADHATLGKGFHELSRSLRSVEIAAARRIAERIDAGAGAHIAFEEEHFYKMLVPLLGNSEVKRMYREHQAGLDVLHALLQHPPQEPLDEALRAELLRKSEAMETHIADCGELFEAMGRIPVEDQSVLFQHLLKWRELNPRWTALRESNRSV